MEIPPLLSPTLPRFQPNRSHQRNASRSPTRERFTDDILADLSPATTLDAFTNPSGKLKASIEAASPPERAFGIRATLASKKIQEWLNELSSWPWPAEGGPVGFEMPATKRRRTLNREPNAWNTSERQERHGSRLPGEEEEEYMGSLLAEEVDRYDVRMEEITEDMEDLDVDAIKRQVLDEHFSAKSLPSSSVPDSSPHPMPSLFSSYTRMDDFTAIITATVLHALPNLSKLMRLMDVWKIRLIVLKKIPPLLLDLDEAEAALISGWDVLGKSVYDEGQDATNKVFLLSRVTFGTMQDVLQDRVTTLGRDLDYMLDTLEGREDTLPESWLDRMETIEQDYGEWVVSGHQKLRQGEWDKMTKARTAEEEAHKLQREQAAEEARLEAEEQVAVEAKAQAEEDAERVRARLEEERIAQEVEIARKKVEMEPPESYMLEEDAAKLVPLPESPAGILFPGISSREMKLQNDEALSNNGWEPIPDVPQSEGAGTVTHTVCIAGVATEDVDSSGRENTGAVMTTLDQGHEAFGKSPLCLAVTENSELNALNTSQLPVQALDEAYSRAFAPGAASALSPDKVHFLPTAIETIETPDTIPARHTFIAEPQAGRPTWIIDDIQLPQHIIPSNSSPPSTNPSSEKRVFKLSPGVPDMLRISENIESPSEDLILAQLDGNLQTPDAQSPTVEMHKQTLGSTVERDPVLPTESQGDWSMVDSFKGQQQVKSKSSSSGDSHTSILGRKASKRHSRNISIIDSSSFSLPAGDAAQPEPSAHFRPILPSIKSIEFLAPDRGSHAMNYKESSDLNEDQDSLPEGFSNPVLFDLGSDLAESGAIPQTPGDPGKALAQPILLRDDPTDGVVSALGASNFNNISVRAIAESTDPNETPRRPSVIRLDTARRDTVGSDTPTVSMSLANWTDSPNGTPKVDASELRDMGEKSPTAGRIGLRISHSRSSSSPPSSPPSLETASKYGSVNSPTSPTFSLSDQSDASTISEAPMFEDLELQSLPPSSPKKSSQDQLQQHISSLLESIPARIRLTSEPDVNASHTLNSKKIRRSVTPSLRSSSSFGSRAGAQTPSFLLAPAYSKTPSRQRPQSAHPDIKVYHLSRSTGETPIKLFVRLVGMKGERVMVRVGGGWADLGEYLTEYASHHGRRSTVETDKVEIQDLPPRIVSSSSTASTATVRGSESGRSTPVPNFRPTSAFARPVSSLNVRKTRKSLGEGTFNDIHGYRSPSTPLPNRKSIGETTPSVVTTAVRSSSRISWTEDDISLGLAGPKGKRVTISEKDQEWVDSMKEKVKQASAEKDRGKEKERRMKERGKTFGELEKVGGTKRLFRKV